MTLKDDCSLEENLTNLDSSFKIRDITLSTKVFVVRVLVFPVAIDECIYASIIDGCESWIIRKAER